MKKILFAIFLLTMIVSCGRGVASSDEKNHSVERNDSEEEKDRLQEEFIVNELLIQFKEKTIQLGDFVFPKKSMNCEELKVVDGNPDMPYSGLSKKCNDSTGKIQSIHVFIDNDRRYSVKYDELGNINSITSFVKGQLHGTEYNFSQEGDLLEEVYYDHGHKKGNKIRKTYSF